MDLIWVHHEKAPKPMQEQRTLQGEKNTFATAHTFSGLTHPYTIGVAISTTGQLGQKVGLYICFQEP
jgi:hypothetical protein